ncbi:hypothetical protein M0Q28_04615 [Patescibacteria group bacterium]|jgi:hypothetical protein|nr:hypothetical protein [Patescibacteria group bacterium]
MFKAIRKWWSDRKQPSIEPEPLPVDEELLKLLDDTMNAEDRALRLYYQLAKRERRGEKIPLREVWRQLQLISPLIGKYETGCRLIDEKIGFEKKHQAVRLIASRRQLKKLKIAAAP